MESIDLRCCPKLERLNLTNGLWIRDVTLALASGKRVVQVLCGGDNAVYSLMMLSSADKVITFDQIAVWQRVCADMSKVIQK